MSMGNLGGVYTDMMDPEPGTQALAGCPRCTDGPIWDVHFSERFLWTLVEPTVLGPRNNRDNLGSR